jgi:hypothetical protein
MMFMSNLGFLLKQPERSTIIPWAMPQDFDPDGPERIRSSLLWQTGKEPISDAANTPRRSACHP